MATADSKIKLNNSLTLRALVVLRDRTLFFNIIYIFFTMASEQFVAVDEVMWLHWKCA